MRRPPARDRRHDESRLNGAQAPRQIAAARDKPIERRPSGGHARAVDRRRPYAEEQPALLGKRPADAGQELGTRRQRAKLPREEIGARTFICCDAMQERLRRFLNLTDCQPLPPCLIAPRGRTGDEAYEAMKREVTDLLRAHFRPEFLNRVDEVIVFHALTGADLEFATGLAPAAVRRVRRRLDAIGKQLSYQVRPTRGKRGK